jgi:uncharacterized membrane protein
MEQNYSFDVEDTKNNKAVAALSYLSILFLIPLLLRRKSYFSRMHAKQGLAVFALEIMIFVLSPLLYAIPYLGTFFVWLFCFISIIICIWGVERALNEKILVVPVLGKYFEKIKI